MKEKARKDVYEIVTNEIISELEKGKIPWHIPWNLTAHQNLVSHYHYHGINTVLLAISSMRSGYKLNYWLTFNQARNIGAMVNKGEKASLVTFWKMLSVKEKDRESGEEKEKHIPLLRYYNVFNVDQCTFDEKWEKKIEALKGIKPELIASCEEIQKSYLARENLKLVNTETSRAYYSLTHDYINIPPIEAFSVTEEYYSTSFHEIVHSSGAPSRLKRFAITDSIAAFGSTDYSKEELVAEIGAAFLCGLTGIKNKTIKNNTAYIQNWLNALENDKRMFVSAAGKAQKAVDYIIGTESEE